MCESLWGQSPSISQEAGLVAGDGVLYASSFNSCGHLSTHTNTQTQASESEVRFDQAAVAEPAIVCVSVCAMQRWMDVFESAVLCLASGQGQCQTG